MGRTQGARWIPDCDGVRIMQKFCELYKQIQGVVILSENGKVREVVVVEHKRVEEVIEA